MKAGKIDWGPLFEPKDGRPSSDIKQMQSEITALKASLGRVKIAEKFEYPAGAIIFAGWWCDMCKSFIDVNGAGHGFDCLLVGVAPDGPWARNARRNDE